jgi:integrase
MSRQTLGEYLEDWMDQRVRGRRAPSTVYGYECIVKQIQAAPIAAVELRDLEPEHLEAYYASLLREGKRGPNTVKKHHVLLATALRRAWKHKKIREDVAGLADPPETVPYEPETYDTEQMRILLGCARRTRPLKLCALYHVAVTGGVRQSEVFGAKRTDLAPDGTLMVTQALVRVPKLPLDKSFKPPKSRKGRRPVVLPDPVLEMLRELRAEQQRDQETLGPRYQDRGLIFATRDGRPLHAHDIVEHDYKRLVEEAGLPFIPFKNLRHSHLSHLERVGTPLSVIQERAGHADPSTTMRNYVRPVGDQQRGPVRRIARELFDDQGPAAMPGHDLDTTGQSVWRSNGGVKGRLTGGPKSGSDETP